LTGFQNSFTSRLSSDCLVEQETQLSLTNCATHSEVSQSHQTW